MRRIVKGLMTPGGGGGLAVAAQFIRADASVVRGGRQRKRRDRNQNVRSRDRTSRFQGSIDGMLKRRAGAWPVTWGRSALRIEFVLGLHTINAALAPNSHSCRRRESTKAKTLQQINCRKWSSPGNPSGTEVPGFIGSRPTWQSVAQWQYPSSQGEIL
jgi:hypothetical protein